MLVIISYQCLSSHNQNNNNIYYLQWFNLIVGSVFGPNDISNKRRKKISDSNDDNNKDIIPEGDHENKQHEDIKEYDDRN